MPNGASLLLILSAMLLRRNLAESESRPPSMPPQKRTKTFEIRGLVLVEGGVKWQVCCYPRSPRPSISRYLLLLDVQLLATTLIVTLGDFSHDFRLEPLIVLV